MKRILVFAISFLLLFAAGCQLVPEQSGVPTAAPEAAPSPTPTLVPTTAPIPTPTPVPEPTRITVMVAGDLLCLGAQLNAAKRGGNYEFDYCFEPVKSTISSADLAIGNLETLVAEGYRYTTVKPKSSASPAPSDGGGENPPPSMMPVVARPGGAVFQALANPRINGPESFLTAVLGAGFDVLTNANNHIYDYGADGLTKTMKKLDEYKVPHTGAYADIADKKPLIVDVKGVKIGIVAYTNVLNNKPDSSHAYMVDRYNEEAVAADIKAAREAGADFIIVCVHWGTEHTHRPNSGQRSIAAFIANAGADMILGAHPHCTQPFEAIETDHGTVPVLYSLGNFISSMGQTIHKDGVIVSMTLEKTADTHQTSLKGLSYIPTLCAGSDKGNFVVYPADAASIAANSPLKSRLEASRKRTIDVLTEKVAKAQ